MSENICYSVALFTCWLFFGAEGKDYAAFDYAVGQKFGLGGARCRVKEVLCFICFFHNYFQKNRNLLFEQRL